MSHHQQRSKARGVKVPKVEVAKDVPVDSSFRDTIGTIAVVPFGAQRLPELQTLYANSCCRDTNKYDKYHSSDAAITTTTTTSTTIRALQSAGRKLSHIRHLRRRATSYKRYKKKAYYQNNKHSNNLNNSSNFNNVVNSTNSINDNNNNNQNSPQIHRPCRKVRRQNIKQLCHLHETWWRHWESQSRTTTPPHTTSNDIAISLLQPSPHNCTTDIHNTTLTTITPSFSTWMTTHLFHRKRCHMSCLWNWYLPLLHINRGCAAALRLVTTIPSTLTHDSTTTTTTTTTTTFGHRSSPPTSKCLIQDTTWSMQPIWFRIVSSNTDDRKKELQQFQTILQSMIPDLRWIELMTTSNDSGTSGCNILSDDSGVMYEPHSFPRKALGPITWIYRKDGPIFHHHHHVNTTTNNTIPESPDRVHTQSNVTSQDYIYFFVHPSIRSTVFHHLKDILVQHQTPHAGIVTDTGIYGPYSGNALNANTGMNPVHPTGVDMGGAMSCFQLRGSNKSCTDCWNNCFTKLQQGQTSIITPESIDHIYQNTSMHRRTVSASCIEQFFSPLYNFLNQSQNGCDDNHNDITVLHIPLKFLTRQQQQQQAFHSEPQREVNASLSLPSELLTMCIRRVVPRDASISCNWGVCGYDIYCPPQYSKILFQDFVLHGGACMIGIVEEAYIALESCPPLLVFPRDYPDTPEGQKYWNHSSVEWNFVRHYWEGGGGRISNIQIGTLDHEMKVDVPAVPNHSAKKSSQSTVINWNNVLGNMDDDNDSNDQIEQNAIVVVRSKDFVQPFQFVLSGCTNFTNEIKISDSDQIVVSESDTKSTTTKKRTRRSPSLANVVAASPISILQRHNHHLMCQSLIDHLSLPAVLMCSVQLLGKGTFHSGAAIYSITVSPPRTRNSTGTTPPPLGWVTTGLFSMTRGYCHGIAMIGAKAFITTIMDGLAVNNDDNDIEERDISPLPYRPPIVIRSCSLSQTKSVQLRVQVENPNCPSIRYDGIVSLLL